MAGRDNEDESRSVLVRSSGRSICETVNSSVGIDPDGAVRQPTHIASAGLVGR